MLLLIVDRARWALHPHPLTHHSPPDPEGSPGTACRV